MLAKPIIAVILALVGCSATVVAQDHAVTFQPVNYGQPPSASADDLEETVRKLQLRLQELEQDVANRIEAQPDLIEAQVESQEDLTETIDEVVDTVSDNADAIENLDGILPSLVYHSHKNPKMTFFGRIHLDYWAFPNYDTTLGNLESGGDPQDRVAFRRMRIGIKGDLNDNMLYKYEGEFAGGEDPSYRDAFIGFKNLPCLQTIIIGNHKRPYGYDHLNSSRYNPLIERPFIVEAFNQDSRRLGISSQGVSEDQRYNWRIGLWNQILTQTSAGYIGDHYQGEVAGRLASTFWYDESSGGRGYAHWAIAGSAGVPDGRPGSTNNAARYRTRPEARSSSRWLDTGAIPGADSNYLIGLESVINVGAFQLASEYMRVNVDRRDAVGEDVEFDGYYVQAGYFLTGEHIPWNRETGCIGRMKPFENFFLVRDCDCNRQRGIGAWQVVARYSYADLTDQDIIGGEGKSLTLGLNWHWNPYARMQLNYIYGDISRAPLGFGDYDIIGVRWMVDF